MKAPKNEDSAVRNEKGEIVGYRPKGTVKMPTVAPSTPAPISPKKGK